MRWSGLERFGAPPLAEEDFRLLRDLVHEHCGLWFRDEYRYLVERRLAPRLALHGLPDFAAYHRFLRLDPAAAGELEDAIEALVTNETYLFREPLQLKAFTGELLPLLAARNRAERRLRILSAGCSTGEEAYTIAILLRASGLFQGWDLEVIGCDISRRCLGVARAAVYGDHAFRAPEAEAMRRFFHLRNGRWVVDDGIRRIVRFEHANLVEPGALARLPRLDVVFCRNVMIYFDLAARRRALAAFHAQLGEGGYLLLGHSESLIHVTADFELVQLREDLVYRKPALLGGRAG